MFGENYINLKLFGVLLSRIYGIPESEKEILERCPPNIDRFKDINLYCDKLNKKLSREKKRFFDALPRKKEREKKKLKKIRKKKKNKVQKYDNRIRDIEKEAKENKHNKKWFSAIFNHLQIFFQRHISKPWNLRKIKKTERKQKHNLHRWKENPDEIFNQEHIELLNRIERFRDIKDDSFYHGAKGEVKVLNELSKLDDDHAILCGLNLKLDDWHSYKGEQNLKSAQMDLVVVSYKGIFLIEVKNWSKEYLAKNKDISPHEQLDRAGKVLYIFLKSRLGEKVPLSGKRLNKVLLPIQNNICYDERYKTVLVSSVPRINNFITDRRSVLDDYEVKRITDTLKPFVTE